MSNTRATNSDAVAFLKDHGVDSLDSLAHRLTSEAARQQCSVAEILRGRLLPQDPVPYLTWRDGTSEGPFWHRPTELTVLIDDEVEVAPGDLPRFNGTALDFVWDEDARASGVLRAFRSSAAAAEYMAGQTVPAEPPDGFPMPDPELAPSFHAGGFHARFYEHINNGGAGLNLDLGHVKADLTKDWLGGIWWWWTSWNDQISSVLGGSGWVTLWEHIYPPRYGFPPGSKLHVAPFQVVSSLVPLGWNDRVSAINHHFFPE